jgi:hypothetical protein
MKITVDQLIKNTDKYYVAGQYARMDNDVVCGTHVASLRANNLLVYLHINIKIFLCRLNGTMIESAIILVKETQKKAVVCDVSKVTSQVTWGKLSRAHDGDKPIGNTKLQFPPKNCLSTS